MIKEIAKAAIFTIITITVITGMFYVGKDVQAGLDKQYDIGTKNIVHEMHRDKN